MADNNISIKISAQDAASPVFQRFLAQLNGMQGKTDEVGKKMAGSFSQMAGGVAQMGAAFSTLTSGSLSGMVSGFTTLNAGLKNVVYCPLGFDSAHFKPVAKDTDENQRVVFSLFGKFEHCAEDCKFLHQETSRYILRS